MLSYFIDNVTQCNKTNHLGDDVYRCMRRVIYNIDTLPTFRAELTEELDSLGLDYEVTGSGIHEAPGVPFRGNAHLETTTHYYIDIKLLTPIQ